LFAVLIIIITLLDWFERRRRFGFTNGEIRLQEEKGNDKKHSEQKEVRMMDGLNI
jgi:hypothetical protein